MTNNKELYFESFTEKYTDGLPIGNGTTAAMVLGKPQRTRFALNHEKIWRTIFKERKTPHRADELPAIRKLILEGQYEEATRRAQDAFSHSRGEFGQPTNNMPYVPAGDLFLNIDTGTVGNYSRRLELTSGNVEIAFDGEKSGKTGISSFISLYENTGIIRIETEKETTIGIELSRVPDESCSYSLKGSGDRQELTAVLDDELYFLVSAQIFRLSEKIHIVLFGIDVGFCPEKLKVSLILPDFSGALEQQKREFQERLGNSEITLDTAKTAVTTDRRIADFADGRDNTVPLLFFYFGKYLMVSGSGELPQNLQGKWNEEIDPPWCCDYHLDINLQMNYWFTDALGMGYANNALFRWCEACLPYGREKAMNLYGCAGICYAVSTDVWGSMFHDTYGWDAWIGAAPWLAQHFYRHYLYTGDLDFLRDHAYPFIRECCAFFADYAVEIDGQLHILPSCSPENRFTEAGELPMSMCADCAMDIALYREVLQYAAEAARLLHDGDAAKWQELLDKTVGLKTDSHGRLLEWDKEYTEAEPGHRHLSHLVGYYPGWLIPKHSELEKACEQSLDYRLSFGGGHTGWSRGWVACLYARMGRKQELMKNIRNLITVQCSKSMLDYHPPTGGHQERIFQIDGNFGGTAAICEAFVSAHYDSAQLLCGCPEEWSTGSVSHFKLPYDTDISYRFRDGRVTEIEIVSGISHRVEITFPNGSWEVFLNAGEKTVKSL